MVLLIPGVGSHKDAPWVGDFVNTLAEEGFAVVLVGYRGLGKDGDGNTLMLRNDTISTAASFDDFATVASYIHEKFCKTKKRKVFAVGTSMGGIVLTGAISKLNFITAAATISCPVDMVKATKHMST